MKELSYLLIGISFVGSMFIPLILLTLLVEKTIIGKKICDKLLKLIK